MRLSSTAVMLLLVSASVPNPCRLRLVCWQASTRPSIREQTFTYQEKSRTMLNRIHCKIRRQCGRVMETHQEQSQYATDRHDWRCVAGTNSDPHGDAVKPPGVAG